MKTPRVPEKVVQAQIVQLLRSLKARVYVLGTTRRKGDHPGTMQTPGIPDVEAFLPPPRYVLVADERERRLVKIEVKAKGGRLRKEQIEYGATCAAAGIPYLVGDLDRVIAWLISEGYLRRDDIGYYHQPKAG